MTRQQTVKAARQALVSSIVDAAHIRGEAQWTNGYRCGKMEDDEWFREEMWRWGMCEKADNKVTRAISAYARAVRREERQRHDKERASGSTD